MMANWRKLLRPGPTPLGTLDLDTVTEPGDYYQSIGARVTAERNYPPSLNAGAMRVLLWQSSSPMQIYYDWRGGTWRREQYLGEWNDWRGEGV